MITDMWGKIKESMPLNILLVCLAVVVAVGVARITREAMDLRREVRKGEEKIAALAARKAELDVRIAELETPEAIEREAKEKLNLKKRGETVVMVVPEENPPDTDGSYGFWQRIRDFFAKML